MAASDSTVLYHGTVKSAGVPDFRICFGKTIAFDFDEKLTQIVAEVTM